MRLWYLVLCLCAIINISLTSCQGQDQPFGEPPFRNQVHGGLVSDEDSSVTFSLFIPDAPADTLLPLMVFFDPHGKTTTVLEQYKKLATQYGFALAGFDPSVNGRNPNLFMHQIRPWLSMLAMKAPIDTGRLFFAGFSGGARIAAQVIALFPDAKAVAMCGAGPTQVLTWKNPDIHALFFAGTGDFNYREAISTAEKSAQRNPAACQLFVGKHAWPPAEVFETFFVLASQLSGKKLSAEWSQHRMNEANRLLQQQRPDLAISLCNSVLLCTGSHAGVMKLRDSISENIDQKFIVELQHAAQQESQLQSYLVGLFQRHDTIHYARMIDSLALAWQRDSVSLMSDVNRRLLAYGGIVAYSFSQRKSQYQAQDFYLILRMYEITEPENPEMLFLMAAWYADKGDCTAAERYFQCSRKNGFNDRQRFEREPSFGHCTHIQF